MARHESKRRARNNAVSYLVRTHSRSTCPEPQRILESGPVNRRAKETVQKLRIQRKDEDEEFKGDTRAYNISRFWEKEQNICMTPCTHQNAQFALRAVDNHDEPQRSVMAVHKLGVLAPCVLSSFQEVAYCVRPFGHQREHFSNHVLLLSVRLQERHAICETKDMQQWPATTNNARFPCRT